MEIVTDLCGALQEKAIADTARGTFLARSVALCRDYSLHHQEHYEHGFFKVRIKS